MSVTLNAGPRASAIWSRIAVYVVILVFAAFFLAPLAVTILTSVRSNTEMAQRSLIGWPQHLDLSNFAVAWGSFCIAERCTGIAPYMYNSAVMAIPATILSTLLGAVAGYAIALWRFRGDNIIFGLVVLGVFLPEQMRLIPWTVVLRDTGLANSLAGLIMIHTIQGVSFTTLFCRNYYLSIPQDLMKAARIDGAGFYRIFWRIILPLSPPILIVTVIWQFTGIWNEFIYAATFVSGEKQPVTAALISISATVTTTPQYGVQSAAVLLAAAPTLLIYLFGGRYFMRGLTAGAVK